MSRKISPLVQIEFDHNRLELILMEYPKSEIKFHQWKREILTVLGCTAGNEEQSVQIYRNHSRFCIPMAWSKYFGAIKSRFNHSNLNMAFGESSRSIPLTHDKVGRFKIRTNAWQRIDSFKQLWRSDSILRTERSEY